MPQKVLLNAPKSTFKCPKKYLINFFLALKNLEKSKLTSAHLPPKRYIKGIIKRVLKGSKEKKQNRAIEYSENKENIRYQIPLKQKMKQEKIKDKAQTDSLPHYPLEAT